jgi:seryl-tRNA synthetase
MKLADLQFSNAEKEKGKCSGCLALEADVNSLTKTVEALKDRIGVLEKKWDVVPGKADAHLQKKEEMVKKHDNDLKAIKEEFKTMKDELNISLRITNGIRQRMVLDDARSELLSGLQREPAQGFSWLDGLSAEE